MTSTISSPGQALASADTRAGVSADMMGPGSAPQPTSPFLALLAMMESATPPAASAPQPGAVAVGDPPPQPAASEKGKKKTLPPDATQTHPVWAEKDAPTHAKKGVERGAPLLLPATTAVVAPPLALTSHQGNGGNTPGSGTEQPITALVTKGQSAQAPTSVSDPTTNQNAIANAASFAALLPSAMPPSPATLQRVIGQTEAEVTPIEDATSSVGTPQQARANQPLIGVAKSPATGIVPPANQPLIGTAKSPASGTMPPTTAPINQLIPTAAAQQAPPSPTSGPPLAAVAMTPTANKSAEAPRQTAMSAAANAPIPPTPPRKTAATSATLATANDVSVANMPGNGPTVSTTPISVPTSTPITHPAVQNAAHQIAAQAQLVQSGQTAEMRLRLRPPDLGEVQVTIRRTATGSLAVHLIPATSEASAALTTNLHLLRGALEPHSQGQSAQVTLTQHHASGSPQHGGRHNEQTPEDTAAANHDTPAQTTASNTLPRPRPNLGTIDYDA